MMIKKNRVLLTAARIFERLNLEDIDGHSVKCTGSSSMRPFIKLIVLYTLMAKYIT